MANEERPRLTTEGAPKITGRRSPSTIADLAARARRHDHGVLVLSERRDGVVCAQVFADLGAAERKVWRTRERGLSASLTLVRLLPVAHLDPDEIGGTS